MQQLRQRNISRGNDDGLWVKSKRIKTNVPLKIPILNRAKAILEKYADFSSLSSKGTVLLIYSNQKINLYLKYIAQKLDIQKNFIYTLMVSFLALI